MTTEEYILIKLLWRSLNFYRQSQHSNIRFERSFTTSQDHTYPICFSLLILTSNRLFNEFNCSAYHSFMRKVTFSLVFSGLEPKIWTTKIEKNRWLILAEWPLHLRIIVLCSFYIQWSNLTQYIHIQSVLFVSWRLLLNVFLFSGLDLFVYIFSNYFCCWLWWFTLQQTHLFSFRLNCLTETSLMSR